MRAGCLIDSSFWRSLVLGFAVVRFVVIDNGDLIFPAQPSTKVDELAAIGAKGKVRPFSFAGLGEVAFADRAQHGRKRDSILFLFLLG